MRQLNCMCPVIQCKNLSIDTKRLQQRVAHLGILDRQQKNSAFLRQQLSLVRDVALPNIGWQRSQCSAVVDGIDNTDIAGAQRKIIAAQNGDIATLPQCEFADTTFADPQRVLFKESRDRNWAQFDANDLMAMLRQPQHVEAFAAERNEDAASGRQVEAGPEAREQRVGCWLVEISASVAPALQPEVIIPAAGVQARSSAFTNRSDS